jgi:GT2 family glycosyltransferase
MKNKIHIISSSHLGEYDNEKFKTNVSETIGTKNYTIEIITNYNELSLSKVYNDFLDRGYNENDILVFCHSDIQFKTKYWGLRLLKHFNKTNYGIIGVAGSKFLPKSGIWWENKKSMCGVVEHTDGEKVWANNYSKEIEGVEPVVCVDGLFISIDPAKIKANFFETYEKFHFYDIPFCVSNYMLGVKIGVITDVRILHKSVGKTNEAWENSRKAFIKDFGEYLPLYNFPSFENTNMKLTKTPKVSIIIPTKNNLEVLIKNLQSWERVNSYLNLDIIVADTGSDPEILDAYEKAFENSVKIVKYDYYSFAKINNDVVKNHLSDDTEVLLFCNDDIFILNDALTKSIDLYNKNIKNIGTIGIRLHYFDSSLQHCGISISKIGKDKDKKDFLVTHRGIGEFTHNYNAGDISSIGNTGAFMLINRKLFNEIGGFNEEYIECFEDVELNVKCLLLGKQNKTICDAVAYHFESTTRNKDKEKNTRTIIDYETRLKPFLTENVKKLKKYIK